MDIASRAITGSARTVPDMIVMGTDQDIFILQFCVSSRDTGKDISIIVVECLKVISVVTQRLYADLI